MRFVYGKQDWKTKERGQENCYLLTNGLGGFSSGTMIGSNTRNDHALLMACVKAPNYRYNMIHRLEEVLETGLGKTHLSAQTFVDECEEEKGFLFLDSYVFEDYPRWIYHVNGVEVIKEIAMKQGENTVVVRYHVENRTGKEAKLTITPHMQFVPKGQTLEKEQEFSMEGNRICSKGKQLFFETNGEVEEFSQKFCEGLYYDYDACDGRKETGNTCVNHRIIRKVLSGEKAELVIVYSDFKLETDSAVNAAEKIFREAVRYRKELVETSGLKEPLAQMLVKSANQFISFRESTGGKTILAGYPFFEDWGRDTMIALPGCCISTGRMEDAKSILRTFAQYCQKGLMPNLFPEGENEPQYNTADAALLFIHAVYLYYLKTADTEFVAEMWKVMEEILAGYKNGTDYNIHMDEDGLIIAGSGLDQVTWMDVRVGEILPTPRHGKPVEINAYWYNALCVMAEFGELLARMENVKEFVTSMTSEAFFAYAKDCQELAQRVKSSFRQKFWNEEKGCLRDVLSGTKADDQIRCNQIWAVSMPFTMLGEEQEKKVVDTVFEKLYTPYGLRTLEKDDPEFCGQYGGQQLKRDLAYHQGTVWSYPLGAYYLAYLKVNHYTEAARKCVSDQIQALYAAMREGCTGQLPEIYDGENPTASRGCFAQAWSVGELLRVFEVLEIKEQI